MYRYILILIIIIIFIFYYYKNNDFYNNILNCKEFIYNIAWEDTNIDLKYLEINKNDNVLMISSAGCNVLNTLLKNPNRIISVDISTCQNALLDLKLSSIKKLNYDNFWKLFGLGYYNNFKYLYFEKLRNDLLLETSKNFWDNNLSIFKYGLYNSGSAIKTMKYAKLFLKKKLFKLCEFNNLNEQYNFYKKEIEPILFNKLMFYIVNTTYWRKISGVPLNQFPEISLIIKSNFLFSQFFNKLDILIS